MPTAKGSVNDRLIKQLEKLQDTAENHGKADKLEEQRKWTQLDLNGWDGNLFDSEGMGKPFDRKEIGQNAKDAVKDPESPGNVGDLILASLQGDVLAAYERAYRARHTGSVRSRIHAAARRVGHGNDAGPIIGGIKGYLDHVEQISKDEENG